MRPSRVTSINTYIDARARAASSAQRAGEERGKGWVRTANGGEEREREREREAECSVKSDCKGAKQIETPERFIIILCLVLRQ